MTSPCSSTLVKGKGENTGEGADPGNQVTGAGIRRTRLTADAATNRTALALVKNISQLTVSEKPVSKTRKGKAADPHPKSLPNASVKVGHKLSNLRDIAAQIGNHCYKNIVVMAGAGISTSSGIPDFRTPGSGLYDNLEQYDIPYPEAFFDIDYFSWNPKPFFCLAKSLYPGNYKPSYSHYFLRLLHDKGLLLRVYTQNIDGLERAAGIPSEKLVEAHGTFLTASCSLCNSPYPSEKAKVAILNDEIPRCKMCSGIVKPDIVFFGESLPKNFFSYRKDFKRSDLLIVMGTSLEIEPFASIVNCVRPRVPRLLLNRDPVGPFQQTSLKHRDLSRLGDLSDSVRLLLELLGWESDLEQLLELSTLGAEAARSDTSDPDERSPQSTGGGQSPQHSPRALHFGQTGENVVLLL